MIETLDFARQHSEMRDEIIKAILGVVDSGRFILGSEVEAFEQDFAAAHGTRHGIGVNSGTDALRIALRAVGVRQGDEVITTANTFVATVGAIIEIGAVPRLVDVAADENLDPELLAAALSPRTRAVVAVHLRGLVADMVAIRAICDPVGVAIVEDCSQAVGAEAVAGPVGSLGSVGCFSLHPQKNLGAIGDAGIITTSSDEIAERCRLLRNHGLRTRDEVETFGYNSRLDPVHAAVLRIKLTRLPAWNERRRRIAAHYDSALRDLPLELPRERPGTRGVYHHYVLRCAHRDELQAHLLTRDIRALVHYPIPIHRQRAFAHLPPVALPVTERQADMILSIPVHSWLSDAEVETVTEAVSSYFRRA